MKSIYNSVNNLVITKYLYLSYLVFGIVIFFSCEEFVNIDPPRDEIISKTVFTNDATATATLNGIYSEMISTGRSFTSAGIERYTGLLADELFSTASAIDEQEFATNTLQPFNGQITGGFWRDPYRYIHNANSALEGLAGNTVVTDSVRNQLEGEARFIRAFCHFYLVNLFGQVPLALTTNFGVNNTLSRASETEVYAQIVEDLLQAEALLSDGFTFARDERTRPNRGAAQALLARVYLYTEDWLAAETYATKVITNTVDYSLETDLNNVFLANSREAIWQLQLVTPPQVTTPQAALFILTAAPLTVGRTVALRDDLYNAFEPGDNRETNWVGTIIDGSGTFYYPFKYQNQVTPLAEYPMILRLGEQYLIRAEARAQQNNIFGSQEDLNVIRIRAGLSNTSANDRTTLLAAIEKERKVELFTEWGHRWLDLKRTGRADEVVSSVSGKDWQSTDQLFPIPETEINNNPNLLPQNPGYN